MYKRQAPSRLLCRALGDLLPAGHLFRRLLLVQPDHAAPGCYRDHLADPQFHGFLHDPLHFLLLGKPLEEIDPGGKLRIRLLFLQNRKKSIFPFIMVNGAPVLTVIAVADHQFLPRTHPEDISHMVDIRSHDQDLPLSHLGRRYEKMLHTLTSPALSWLPPRPCLLYTSRCV